MAKKDIIAARTGDLDVQTISKRLRGQKIGKAGLGALEEAGYYTAGFEGETYGEYETWFQEAFGVSPFETAAALNIGGAQPTDVSAAAWIRANPLDYSPEEGFTGTPTTMRGIAQMDIQQQRFAAREERQERESGMAMMRWLMGQAVTLGGGEFQRLAGVGMPMAQAQVGYQAPQIDLSGLMGVMGMERMEAEAARARQFDFTRDLLPALITLGGSFGGGK